MSLGARKPWELPQVEIVAIMVYPSLCISEVSHKIVILSIYTLTIPTFKNIEEERVFWETHDTLDYLDETKVKKVRFPNLKKTTKSISIRLPVDMIDELKVRANSMDVPYQSFIKMLLKKGLNTP